MICLQGSSRAGAVFSAALLVLAACAPAVTLSLRPPEEAPSGMSAEAWTHGLAAHDRATRYGLTSKNILTIIDFSLSSSERRLWVVDLETGQLLMHEYVAHAMRSGTRWATSFSNRDGSNQSSLGTFLTARTYVGVRGLSLRLRGLEPGINDRAEPRGIVIHGTPTVNPLRAAQGRLGRTEGCPAVSMESARRLIRLIEDGVVVFAWYPDRAFLGQSDFVDPGAAAIRLSQTD
jgi:L,D-transpeptidase catalytic domain